MKLYIGGKIVVRMIGAYCEKFVSELFRVGIKLSSLRNDKGVLFATAKRADYKTIAKLSRQFSVQVRVSERRGIYFTLRRVLNRRLGLLAGVFSALILTVSAKAFIWHIDIHGNEKLSESYIYSLLEKNDITIGKLANSVDSSAAELSIMLNAEDVGWINIEVNGSRADVYINEIEFPAKDEIDLKTPCNIVSAKTGTIVKSNVYSGKMLYKEGTGVSENTVLVSGTITDDNGNLLLVHSDAEIIADFFDELSFTMPYITTEKVPTGKNETVNQFQLLGFVFPPSSVISDTSNKICTEEIKNGVLFGIKMPWKVKTDTYTEYESVSITRKTDDIKRLLENQLEMHCFNFYKDYEILETEKSFDVSEEGVTLNAVVKLRGNIAVKQAIYEH